MKALKINITKFISQEERDKIYKYSKLLGECYNLCLEKLKESNDWRQIHYVTKEFQHQHKEIYSKHAQNIGRESVNAVRSFLALRKKDKTAKYPKNFRKYSVITLDANLQKKKDKNGNDYTYLGGGFKFTEPKKIKFNYPEIILDLSRCSYFDEKAIHKDTIKQILIKVDEVSRIWMIFVYAEPKKEQMKDPGKEFISIDLGIKSIASIYSSKGECLKYQTQRFKGLEKAKDKLKSSRDRCKKGSESIF